MKGHDQYGENVCGYLKCSDGSQSLVTRIVPMSS